ncbi:MAG: hypothetical protein JETCAE03_33610 [Ignavibacteriaceae bacterium]|nr:MAG: hypothetical protein JETCAE03_33610 [Ignavibacteriaceae bacterium]
MKLSKLLKEEDQQDQPLTPEEKKAFLEEIKHLDEYGKKLYSEIDLVELATKLSELAKRAHKVTLEETGDWFDKVTVNRNMKEVHKISEDITKTATEAKAVQQRLTSLYEDLKHVLGRYFEVSGENEKDVVEDDVDIYNPEGQNTSLNYLQSNFEDFKKADELNKKRIKAAYAPMQPNKRNIS